MIYGQPNSSLQYTKGHKIPYFFYDSEASKKYKWSEWVGGIDFEKVSPKKYVASGWLIAAPTQLSWWEE